MATTILAAIAAASTAGFVSSLGVNTHFGFHNYGYQNVAVAEQAISYLGVTNLRDSGTNASDAQIWQQVAQATGARFDDYMPEGSPAGEQSALNLLSTFAQGGGVVEYLEGGNEEDDSYAAQNGNSLSWTAQFQQQVFQTGHALGLQVINMSFGSGWTAANNWQGDYGAVGDLSIFADFGNAHTYPQAGQSTDWVLQNLNGLAHMASLSRQVFTTEIGWDENQGFQQSDVAKYVVDAAFDGWKDGNPRVYFYALFNDGSGNFGLMNQDGTPKPAGAALHALTTLLADQNSSFSPAPYSVTVENTASGDNSLILAKSDGSYWIALWNEQANNGSHMVTLALPSTAAEVRIYDPLQGAMAQVTMTNTSSVPVSMPDHPQLVQIIPGAAVAQTAPSQPQSQAQASPQQQGNSAPAAPATSASPYTVPVNIQQILASLPAGI